MINKIAKIRSVHFQLHRVKRNRIITENFWVSDASELALRLVGLLQNGALWNSENDFGAESVQLHHIAVGLQQRRHHDIPLVHCVSFAAPEQISHDLCVLGPAHFVFGDSNQSMLLSLNQKVSTSDLCAIA